MGTPMSEAITLTSSRSGLPNVEVLGVPYHSPYDPEREAGKFYSGLPLEGADVVVHFGWGLGYGAAFLSERLGPDARVFILEPDEDLYDLFRREGAGRDLPDDPRFRFVVGAQVSQFVDDWGMEGCRDTDQVLWVVWPRSLQRHSELAKALQQAFNARLRDRAANLLTHFENGRTYFRNAVANFRHAGDPLVGELFGKFRGVPLVLVAAGPSLDRNIRHLRGAESRCFILAVDTALRPLLAAGITPHAVVLADPTELNASHIVGAVPASTFLIAEQAAHPSAMITARRRFQFSVGVFPDELHHEFGRQRTGTRVWGSVATAALDLACRMGADPIIFIGQDFSHAWGRDYASHTIFHSRLSAGVSADRTVTDLWGLDVQTTEDLIAYRDFVLRRISEEGATRFINASEGGVLYGGKLEILSLRDALHQVAVVRRDVEKTLARLHRPIPVRGRLSDHLLEVLEGRRSNCDCRAGFLDLVAKKALLENDRRLLKDSIDWGIQTLNELMPGARVASQPQL